MTFRTSTCVRSVGVGLLVWLLFGADWTSLRGLFAQVDIAPTILDLVGVEAPHHFQGRSWLKPESAANHHRYALFYKNDTFSLHSAARTYYGQVDAPSDSSPLAPQAVDLAALLAYTIHQDQVWEPLLIESPKEFLKTLKDTLHWPSNE